MSHLAKLTIAELKNELQLRSLSLVGKKVELIKRIESHDKEKEMETVAQLQADVADEDSILIDEDVDEINGLEKEMETVAQLQANVADEDSILIDEDVDEINGLDAVADYQHESVVKKEVEQGDADDQQITDQSDEKPPEKEQLSTENGVVIETVGEVDDDEFVAAVAKFEDDEENEAAKREKKAKKIKEMKELPSKPMKDWLLKQYSLARNFSSIFVKNLSAMDVLSDVMYEWASRAIYFCINSERDGKGAAVLHFVTEKECKEAKEVLTSTIGGDVKIVHPSRHQESDMRKNLSYQFDYPNLASRTLLVEDAPEDATEDQIAILFNGAISVSRLVGDHSVTWQGEDYKLPENIGHVFFVEFGTSKDLKEATVEGKEYEIAEQKLKVLSSDAYYKAYRDQEDKRREEFRQKRRAEVEKQRKERLERLKTKVLDDKVRIEKCNELEQLEKKRSLLAKNMTMTYNEKGEQRRKYSKDIQELVKLIDKDTDYREQLEMNIPETKGLMTTHTKTIWRRNHEQRSKEQQTKEKETDGEKHQSTDKDKKKSDKDTREVKQSDEEKKESQKKKDEEKKKEADKKRDERKKEDEKKKEEERKKEDERKREDVRKKEVDRKKTEIKKKAESKKTDDKKRTNAHGNKAGSGHTRSKSPHQRMPVGSASHKTHSRSPRRRSRSPTAKKEKMWDFAVRTTPLTDRDRQGIRNELEKMEEDTRGWWHLLLHKPNDPSFKERDCEKMCNKYGRVMEVHFTNEKIFVRFNSHSAVSAAIRDLWGSKLKVEVPHINTKYKMKKYPRAPELGGREVAGDRRLHETNDNRGESPQPDNPLAVAMKQQQQVQQQQQQMLLQQFEEQQQMQQASMYVQAAVSAMQQKQQQPQFIGDSGLLGPMPSLQQTHNLVPASGVVSLINPLPPPPVPAMFGATGVAPPTTANDYSAHDNRPLQQQQQHHQQQVKSNQRDINRGRDRPRTPEKRHYTDRADIHRSLSPDSFDSKRARMEERGTGVNRGNYGYDNNRTVELRSRSDARSGLGNNEMHNLQDLTKTISSQVEHLSRLTGTDANQVNPIKGVLNTLQNVGMFSNSNSGTMISTAHQVVNRGVPLLANSQPPMSQPLTVHSYGNQQRHINRSITSTGDGLLPAPPSTSRLTAASMQVHVGGPTVQHMDHPSALLRPSPGAARISVHSGSMQVGIGGSHATSAQNVMYPITSMAASSIPASAISDMQARVGVPFTGLHPQQTNIKPPLLTNPQSQLHYTDDRMHPFRTGRL